jgi:hypothetical protein
MRLRFAVTGQAKKPGEHDQETKPPLSETNAVASTTNDEQKIKAATGS